MDVKNPKIRRLMSKSTQTDKVILTQEEYRNLLKMMTSDDTENHLLALSIIDNCNVIESKVIILLLKKMGKPTIDLWKEHASNVVKELKKTNLDIEKVITYQALLDHLLTTGSAEDQVTFFLKEFAEDLKNNIKSIGYNFIEDIEIELKLKDKDATTKA